MRKLLSSALSVSRIEIEDDGARHIGHAGARDGRGHFNLTIVSDGFEGLNRLSRHRLIYNALGRMMETDIHALSIRAMTENEAMNEG